MPSDLERSLLDQGLAQIRALGVTVDASQPEAADGEETLVRLRDHDAVADFAVRLRLRPTSAALTDASDLAEGDLLVTRSMPEKLAEIARTHGVNFVDAAGNMYIRRRGLVLDVRGRRPPTAAEASNGRTSRAFKAFGLRVVFLLLCDPDRINSPYRALAQSVGASLGTVHGVITDLEVWGHLSSDDGRRRLHRTRELFDRWVDAYALILYDRLTLAWFDTPDPAWWRRADEDLRDAHAQWGGETAAHHLDPHLRPQRTVVYADVVPSRLVANYRLTKAATDAPVEIRSRFWQSADDAGLTVPTPLIYADLIASADPRLLDAAADLRTADALLRRLDRS
jgi:hypothetical protein